MSEAINALETELETFEGHHAELLGTAEGQWALVHDDAVIGVFETQGDAVKEGYRRLGNVPFLVKQILTVEVPQHFVSNLIAI